MCTVSMIMDHFGDKWGNPQYRPGGPYRPNVDYPIDPPFTTVKPTIPITDAEIEEFRKLLERAREYDRRNNEPECELESKKQKIRDLAKELGIEEKVNFL